MRIGLLCLHQSVNDRPQRFISRSDAKNGLLRGELRRLSKKLYQEIDRKTVVLGKKNQEIIPSSSPERHFTQKLDVVVVSKSEIEKKFPLKTPTTLNLYYPVQDQSSYRIRNFREVWGCDADEWQRRLGAS